MEALSPLVGKYHRAEAEPIGIEIGVGVDRAACHVVQHGLVHRALDRIPLGVAPDHQPIEKLVIEPREKAASDRVVAARARGDNEFVSREPLLDHREDMLWRILQIRRQDDKGIAGHEFKPGLDGGDTTEIARQADDFRGRPLGLDLQQLFERRVARPVIDEDQLEREPRLATSCSRLLISLNKSGSNSALK